MCDANWMHSESRHVGFLAYIACITLCKNSFIQFFALENMGIAVEIVQLRCIQAEI